MNGRVLVVCPTRDNPEGFVEMRESLLRTSTLADLAVYVDLDQRTMYPCQLGNDILGPRIGPVEAANKLVEANPGYDAYGFVTDDAKLLTPGWDKWLLSTIASKPGRVVAISPFWSGTRHLSFPFLSAEWIKAVGYFAHPKAYHFCWDTIVELLAEESRVVFANEDQMAISHPNNASKNLKDHFEKDARSFLFWAIHERRDIVERLRSAAR